jgi:3-oxoadipate enol-lactonase
MATLPIDNVKLHATGTGPALVLVHCLGVDHRMWDFAVEALGRRFTVLTYDVPGHGAAPVPAAGYTIEDLSAQLAALLQRQGVQKAHVAGMSLGGLVAQHFAGALPERVEKLILADTTARYVDDMRAMWVRRAAEARAAGTAALTEGILKIWFTDKFREQNPSAVRYVRECFARTPGEGYALACEALGAADLRAIVPAIRAPTLVICGDQDIPSFVASAQWLSTTIPGARLEWLSPAKHASPLEHPGAFLRLVERFLG